MQVTGYEADNDHVKGVWSEAAARKKYHSAKSFILATGGLLGGGIVGDQDGAVHEIVFNLPLVAPRERLDWFKPHFLDPSGQPIFQTGIQVNSILQPTDHDGCEAFTNLYIAGSTIGGGDFLRERSYEGIAGDRLYGK
jgi:glycerol-3-phosphate dehydrogenase subunit B